jgi:hypothetical protein
MPQKIEIIGIEADDVFTLSEECTTAIEAAIPAVADMIVKEVDSI